MIDPLKFYLEIMEISVSKSDTYQPEKKPNTVKCLYIGTPKNNKISICSKCKIDYFLVSQNLVTIQSNCNVLKYWNT